MASDSGSGGSGRDDWGESFPPPGGDAGGDPAGTPPPPPPPPGGGPPPPPPAPAAHEFATTGQPVDIGPRLGARLIDFVLLTLVGFVVSAFLVDVDTTNPFSAGFTMSAWIANLVNTAISVGYFTWLESSRGQTVGKRLLRMRVVGPDGGNPTMEQALKRNLWIAAAIVPAIGGLVELGLVIWIIVTITQGADKRGVHDRWAGGTQVVRV